MIKSFFDTKTCFASYINYTKPLSYEEWVALCDDYKAAALFVQFFDQILLAWDKATTFHTFHGDDEEAVETALQYLIKNVDIIKNDSKRYSPRYIYSVAYNALYCIVHDRKVDKFRRENEVPLEIKNDDGEEFSRLDFKSYDNSDDPEVAFDREMFWGLIEDMGQDALDLVDKCLRNGELPKKLSTDKERIVAELRIRFSEFEEFAR